MQSQKNIFKVQTQKFNKKMNRKSLKEIFLTYKKKKKTNQKNFNTSIKRYFVKKNTQITN